MLSFTARAALEAEIGSGKVSICELLKRFEQQAVQRRAMEPVPETFTDQYSPVSEPPDLKTPDLLTTTRASVLGTILRRKMFEEQGLAVVYDE